MSEYVRVHCDSPNYTTGACVNTPDGGRFREVPDSSTSIVMYYGPEGGETVPGLTIRYTTDGSEPSPASHAYSEPIDLANTVPSGSNQVNIRVKAEINGTMVVAEANTTWSRW